MEPIGGPAGGDARGRGITATGAVEGFAPLDRLTGSLEEAVRGADIVAVTLPTPARPSLAPKSHP